MPYEMKANWDYDQPYTEVYKALYLSVEAMQGKILVHKPDEHRLEAQMDKKLYGKVLGDRSRLEVDLTPEGESKTRLTVLAYPVNPVGQKLMFGARKGVVPTVLKALYEEIASRLPQA